MASGVPVVTSNTSSLPEVAGDAAILIDPTSTDEIAAAMYRILMDEDTMVEMRVQGPLHARPFSWTCTAKRTLEVYCKAVNTG